jgi:tetratricopeptide (TPR) repeat protein
MVVVNLRGAGLWRWAAAGGLAAVLVLALALLLHFMGLGAAANIAQLFSVAPLAAAMIGWAFRRDAKASESDSPSGSARRDESEQGQIVVGDIPQEPKAFQSRAALALKLAEPQGREGVPVIQVLTGLLGVGKTHLAAAYARSCMNNSWRLVAWINAKEDVTMLGGLAAVAAALGVEYPDVHATQAGEGVRHWLETRGDRCLIVFDNVSDPDIIRPFLPATGKARVLITSSQRPVANLGQNIPIGVFTEEEALSFLAMRAMTADLTGAAELTAELGYLPLAIAQAAAFIHRQHISYETYLLLLRKAPVSEIFAQVRGEIYPRSLAAAVLLSIDEVREFQGALVCGLVMNAVSVLSPDGISRSLLYTFGKLGALSLAGKSEAIPSEVDHALAQLADASLLSFSLDGKRLSAHRLVMRIIRDHLSDERRLGAVYEAVGEVLSKQATSVRRFWEQFAVRDLLEQIRALCEHADSSSITANSKLTSLLLGLRLEAARFADDLGDSPAENISLAQRLLADHVQEFGPKDPRTMTASHNLAVAYQQAGRVDEAIAVHQKNLDDREKVLGPTHPDTMASRNNLAIAYQEAKRFNQAITLHQENLDDREKVLGPTHPDTMASRNNLAVAYQADGRVEEAIAVHQRNLADRERVLRRSHPEAGGNRNNISTVYQDQGKASQSIPLYECTRADGDRELNADHPDTLASRNNLATAYLQAGQADKSVPLLEQTLADKERLLGERHPSTLVSRNNLATAYLQLERFGESIELLEQTFADCRKVLGADHGTTQIVKTNLTSARAARRPGVSSLSQIHEFMLRRRARTDL